mmetsp:Transcript_7406/g.10930  ORF Transcript_7406/g.10930 Transcript_7406/m.10930 type:complete len:127 (-) Transcript_7406:2204-2584(-)
MARYVTNETVVDWMRKKKPGFLIIDVRESDFAGGNIKGAINMPAFEFKLASMKKLCDIGEKKNIDTFVFHCMYSQSRGPATASSFTRYTQKQGKSYEILVLKGGWKTFYRHVKGFKDENELIENVL